MIFTNTLQVVVAIALAVSALAQDVHYDTTLDDPQLREAQKSLSSTELALLKSARKMLATDQAEAKRILESKDPDLLPQRLCLTIAKLEKSLFRRKVMKELLEEGNERLAATIDEQRIFTQRILEEVRLLDLDIENLKKELAKPVIRP